MKQRLITAAIGLPILLLIILVLPPVVCALAVAACCAIAAYEMLWRTGIVKNIRVVIYAGVAAVATSVWSYLKAEEFVNTEVSYVICSGIIFLFVCALFGELLAFHAKLPFTSVCVAFFSGLIFPFLLSALTRLICMDNGRFYVVMAFMLAMIADTGGYFAGRAFGKHKLAPIISPKKTIEGSVGGIVLNIIVLVIYTLVLNKCFGFTRVNYLYAVIYAVVGAFGSMLGDLSMSVVKRQVGIKDYGIVFPGHGGVLDRADSIMICAPIAEILLLVIPFAVK